MELSLLIYKIKKFFKATFSFIPNYYSDFENAYYEGYSEGYEEGKGDGFSFAKTDASKLWDDIYEFLEKRGHIDRHEELSHIDMIERLIAHDNNMKDWVEQLKKRNETQN